mmetsp:Transcript_14152/g.39132  ORF Transcript_14152/g.39132 Transcript_14152/m.39132 type:complete len:215 (-) Transcript_14152:1836-2480(-)
MCDSLPTLCRLLNCDASKKRRPSTFSPSFDFKTDNAYWTSGRVPRTKIRVSSIVVITGIAFKCPRRAAAPPAPLSFFLFKTTLSVMYDETRSFAICFSQAPTSSSGPRRTTVLFGGMEIETFGNFPSRVALLLPPRPTSIDEEASSTRTLRTLTPSPPFRKRSTAFAASPTFSFFPMTSTTHFPLSTLSLTSFSLASFSILLSLPPRRRAPTSC